MGRRLPWQDRVEAAVGDEKPWRAKEILSGRVSSCAFDPDLYEQYGRLLLRMGDVKEAGRFLFVSGRRRQEYDEAIALFLRQTSRAGYRPLLASFPNRVRQLTWEQLPAQLQADLRAAGVPELSADSHVWARLPAPPVGATGCLGFALTLAALGLIAAWLIAHFGYR